MAKADLLPLLTSRLTLAEKFGKSWKDDVKKWENDYRIETMMEAKHKVEGIDNLMQIPYIFSTIESGLPAMFETMPSIILKQRGKEDRDFTEFADKVWEYVIDITQIEEKIEEIGQSFLISGLGVVKFGWVLETEEVEEEQEVPITNEDGTPVLDEAGQPVMTTTIEKVKVPVVDKPFVKPYSYKEIFFSPESHLVTDDEENAMPYVICKSIHTADKIRELFGKKVKEESLVEMNMSDLTGNKEDIGLEKEEAIVKSDIKRACVYEYYGTLPKSMVSDKNWRSEKVYYLAYTTKEILKEPEPMGKKPFLFIGNYSSPSKFFPFGEPKILRSLEQDISLGRSRIADLRDKQGTKIALPQMAGEVDEESLKKAGDYTIMRYTGNTPPQYMTPPPVPETILTALNMSREDIQMTSAQLDISRGGMSSTVDTATGQKIFQQSTDKRNARKRKKIAKLIRHLAKNLLMLCAHNWDVETFAQITDMTPDEIMKAQFIQKLQNLGREYDLDIDIETVTSNKETMSAQAIALYRETKDDQTVNRSEILKHALKIGFGIRDFERFMSNEVQPEQMLQTLEFLVQNGMMQEEQAEQIALLMHEMMGGEQAGTGQVGRPPSADPTAIMQKSMAGADGTQMTAQRDAAYKQQGVPKGAQGT